MSELANEGEFEIVSLTRLRKHRDQEEAGRLDRPRKGTGRRRRCHAGLIEERQVSLLAVEEIERARLALRRSCALSWAEGA